MVDVELAAGLGQDRVGKVGERDADGAMVEVHADHRPGAGVQRQQGGRPATMRGGRGIALGDEAVALQLAHEIGHGRARQPGLARDLPPAHLPALANDLEHA